MICIENGEGQRVGYTHVVGALGCLNGGGDFASYCGWKSKVSERETRKGMGSKFGWEVCKGGERHEIPLQFSAPGHFPSVSEVEGLAVLLEMRVLEVMLTGG